jgi:adenylyltransferase/sulfurtransferase
MTPLDEQQLDRYSPHIACRDIGTDGQLKLAASRLLIVGVGGLGSPAALYLAAAGVGVLGLVDDDRVETGNLQRQVLHHTADVDRPKTASAREKIAALNPSVEVVEHGVRLAEDNAEELISGYDFAIDATDNFASKYLINDVCVRLGKPYSHAGVAGFKGQAFTFVPGSLCLKCLFPDPPAEGSIMNCVGEGILGATAGVIGSVQAAEAIKFLIGRDDLLADRLLTVDLLKMDLRTVPLNRNPNCPTCGLTR